MRKPITKVLESMSQAKLASIMGCSQPRINQLKKIENAVVVFDKNKEITQIEYNRSVKMKRKGYEQGTATRRLQDT